MANYHCTVNMISRTGGKSCVASLAYRSATKLEDRRTGDTWDYTNKGFVNHVEILLPEDAPRWVSDIAEECRASRQAALQKLSDVFEATEKRKDSQVYREVEFSLPTELTDAQNIKWANEFIRDVCCTKGMVAVMNFHFDVDPETGEGKPHCHVLLSTRNLTEDGLAKEKNREWNRNVLIHELRQQYEQYQNLALKEHGFDVRVDHRSYEGRLIDIDPQPKLGKQISEMSKRGIPREKQAAFDGVKLKNQFKIVRSPEIVFSIVTSNHSTFTGKDIAKVLNRYIDDADQFRILHGRLMGSRELVPLTTKEGQEPVYTTREMLRIEMDLVSKAEGLAANKTYGVNDSIIGEAVARQNAKLSAYEGLSADQEAAIRHMLSPGQVSCVVGFAGAGKTTSLEAAREGWERAGYNVLGLAPTGKAARNIEGSGIRAMTLHKFLLAQQEGREQISEKTVLVLDEAGMVDSRRMSELVSLMEKTGAKGVAMGDGRQVQAVEAGSAFRLLTDRVKPVVLETVVRQQVDWQRDAARWFGEGHAAKALSMYQEKGFFRIIPEAQLKESLSDPGRAVDSYCLARQVSGRIWKEIEVEGRLPVESRPLVEGRPPVEGRLPVESRPPADEKAKLEASGALDSRGKFPNYAQHPDYKLYQVWKGIRQEMVQKIIEGFDGYKDELAAKGLDVGHFGALAAKYREGQHNFLGEIRDALRKMSYDNIVDTRAEAKEELVKAWGSDRQNSPHESHLMLAFTNKDANSLNESARILMRAAGEIKGSDYTVATQRIDTDDFGKEAITYHNRTFAQGDRLLFTRNDNRLGVSNGTLGTILEIARQKMTVALDGADRKTVSFSPNLYPYLDNGWATTIHKAQGVTVDHVKMLASFEQYRNLSYVGMTRHRHTLQVFGSDLDFWREDKVVDRLSRVQEKLSGFDYLDADKIRQVLAEDTAILWHDRKIGEAKDLWSAAKVTAHGLFNQLTGSSQQPDKGTGEGFPSFDHSEEKRSTEFFQDGSLQGTSLGSSLHDTHSLDGDISIIHTHEKEDIPAGSIEGTGAGSQCNSSPAPLLRESQGLDLQKGQGGIEGTDDTVTKRIDMDGFAPEETQEKTKNYSPQEQEILDYLAEEVTPKKHTWLKGQFASKVLDLAKDGPFAALGKWQRVSRDFSFEPSLPAASEGLHSQVSAQDLAGHLPEEPENRSTAMVKEFSGRVSPNQETSFQHTPVQKEPVQETPERQYNPREAETLAYLAEEIDVQKHGWLSKRFCQELLQAAAKNPLQALARWQDISEDYSFKPSAPTTSLTEDQIKIQEAKALAGNEKIMTYLREEVRLEKHAWLDDAYRSRIFDKAGEDPVKGLKLWQSTSEDYSFNPFEDQLSPAELNVQKYMKQKLLQENDLTLKQNETLKATLIDNPLETYRKWQSHTGDQMFDPETGAPRKQTEVRELMMKARNSVSTDLFKEWQERVVNSPETVGQECREILKTRQHNDKIALAAKEFVSLSEQYKDQALSYSQKEKITQTLKRIADPHLNDKMSGKQFLEKIESWGSKAASSRMEETLAMREQHFRSRDHQLDR